MNDKKIHLTHYNFSQSRVVIFNVHSHPLIPEPIFDMHLAPEIGVVLSGKMARYSGDSYSELPRGGVWIAGVLEPHGRSALQADSKVAVFILSTELLFSNIISGIDNHLWQTPFNMPAKRRPVLVDEEFAILAERLIEKIAAGGGEAIQRAQIQLTLLEIMLHVNRVGKFDIAEKSSVVDFSTLRPSIEKIYSSRRPTSTSAAAKLCKLSPSRFSQLFVKATGLSFSKFSLRYRLSQVARELKNSDCSLDELAEKWGFTDKSHLFHRFKEHYNATPALYRKQ